MGEARQKIHILDEVVANKIAAGEVVERPASVVKELVENAIDAGATRIQVEVEEGGKHLIRVTDNGCGMSEEDAVLALQRHATSKISTAEDLANIHTLGFRGEALPSIASVSTLILTTCEPDASAGVTLKVEGGVVTDFRRVGCPPGTTVEVRKLFYNTPARLKFLKTSGTEMGHISDLLSHLALLYHQIGFRLVHNGQEILSAPACADLRGALATIYGKDLAREMVPIDLSSGAVAIRGYIGKPSLARANRNYQAFFVNGRSVRSRVLQHALYEGYSTLLMTKRHPVAVVIIEVDPQLVDVNVHPAKAEVRFTRDWEVHNLLQKAVREALSQAQLLPHETLGERAQSAARKAQSDASRFAPGLVRPPQQGTLVDLTDQAQNLRATLRQKFQLPVEDRAPAPAIPGGDDLGADVPAETDTRLPRQIIPLAQVKNSYILAETEEGLLVIDQHALHERILYEQMLERVEKEPTRSQLLVIPFTLQLSPREARALEENLDTLTEFGFQMEPFGRDAYLVRGVPLPIAKQNYERILRDLIDELVATASAKTLTVQREELLQMMACKAAVKAGDALAPEEIDHLIRQLRTAQMPFACNHGRPTMIMISDEELERKFKRR